jgi:cobalamin biosynthesis protein CobT
MPVLRAWGNQKAFIEFMADKWHLVESMTDKMKGRIGKLNSLQSTYESTELAKELALLLSTKTKLPQQAPQSPSPFKIPTPPSSEVTPEEPEKPEEETPPIEMPDLNSQPNEVEPSEEQESTEETTGNSPQQVSEEDKVEEEEDVSISADKGVADEEEIESGTDNVRMEETTDSDSEIPDKVEELEEEEETFTGIPDFDQILSHSINEMSTRAAVDNFDAGIYSVYTRDNDRVEPHKIRRTTQELGMSSVIEMDERVKHVTGTMQKTLERLVFAKTNCRNVGGKTRGRINSNSLFKLKVGDSRVFKQKEENKSDEVVVSLLIDCSGSMRNGHKIDIAMQSAFALAGTLSHLNIPFEILGFTTISMDKVRGLNNAVRDADKVINEISAKLSTSGTYLRHHTAFSRVEPLYIPVFKGFNEKFGRVQKLRMIDMMTKTTALNNNIDGESLEIAFNRLSKQHEKGKYMMVLSDGNPVGRGKSEDLIQSLTDTVKNIEAKGTKIIGIGIVSEDVTHFYKDSVVVNNVSELPHVMMKELRHILNA